MVTRKRDKGGEERGQADNEASRIARRAARDRAFGRDPGNGAEQEEDEQDSAESAMPVPGHKGRREVPMTGSAREVRRLRKSGVTVQAMLEEIKCDELAADISKKRNMLYIVLALVGVALVVWGTSLFFHWTQVTYVTKFSILAAPICMAFGVTDLCLYIARTNPSLARKLLGFLSFGNPHSVRTLAWLYIDTGDYSKAEKIIASAVKTIDAKKKLRDYILMHAFLANLRAHVGRTEEAEQLIREVLNAAEAHNKERETNGSAFLLANTLNYAAQLCDQKDKIQDALALSRRAVKLLCEHKKPPADVCLVALSNAGYYCNVVGEFQEALTYLTKAHELATKTNIARDGQMAFILSNLAIANLGVGRSTMCKRNLNDAETKAMTPLGLAERPHTYQCWAIYHFANDRLEYALQSYEKAIEYCGMQKPRDSVLLLRIIKEYSVLLREVGKTNEAAENEQRVTQIRDTMYLNARAKDKKEKKDKKDKKGGKTLAVPVTKSRFPIFWTILACFWGFSLWNEGVRMAPFTQWLLFMTSLVVIVVKLFSKYGPKTKEEASQGAIVAVVSLIPGLRAIAPELSTLPQKTGGIIIGAAVAVIALVKLTSPAPNTVPDFGLLGKEYLVLGDDLLEKESFTKAKKAYELAVKNGETQYAQPKLVMSLPKVEQSEEAIDDNMKALELSVENEKDAKKAWEACVRKYPEFEFPYVHLAALTSPSGLGQGMKAALKAGKGKDKSENKDTDDAESKGAKETEESKAERKEKVLEAERLLKKALSINPNCGPALMQMSAIQSQLGRRKAGRKYMRRFTKLAGDSLPGGALLNALEKFNDEHGIKDDEDSEDNSSTPENAASSPELKDYSAGEEASSTSEKDSGENSSSTSTNKEESSLTKRDSEDEDDISPKKKGSSLIETPAKKIDADAQKDENGDDAESDRDSTKPNGVDSTSITITKHGSTLSDTPSKKQDSTESTKDSAATKKGSSLIETTSKKKDSGESIKDSAAPKKGGSLIETPAKKNANTKVSKPVEDDGGWGETGSSSKDSSKKFGEKKQIDTSKNEEPKGESDKKQKKMETSKSTDVESLHSKNWLEQAAVNKTNKPTSSSSTSETKDATTNPSGKKNSNTTSKDQIDSQSNGNTSKPSPKPPTEEEKSSSANSALSTSEHLKRKKEKEKEARRAKRHADDWKKLSPNDTDW